jgi:hypothetical protein
MKRPRVTGLSFPIVVQPIGGAAAPGILDRDVVERGDHAFDDVVDVREVAPHLAVIEDVDGPAVEDRLGEGEVRHVRPSPGSVHREEAQPGGREAEEVAVRVRHELVRLLRRRVEANGVIRAAMYRERDVRVRAVDGARGGVHEVLDPGAPAQLEHVGEADEVAGHVGRGVGDRIPNSGLGREVEHPRRGGRAKGFFERRGVGDVDFVEGKFRMFPQQRQAVVLEADVVVVVQVVDAADLAAELEQPPRTVEADEAGRARYDDAHQIVIRGWGRPCFVRGILSAFISAV